MRRSNSVPSLLAVGATVGFLSGLFGTALLASDELRWPSGELAELRQITRLEPIRALPRTEMVLLALEARGYLAEGRPWAAWTVLRPHVAEPDEVAATTVLLAARAAGGWGGWDEARRLLNGREWLERTEGGEGLFLLGRANEETGNPKDAVAAYRRYAALSTAASRGIALARMGGLLRAEDDAAGAAAAFGDAATQLPEVEDWLRALQVEQLEEAGSPAAAQLATNTSGGAPAARLRRVRAEASAYAAAGDVDRAVRRLEWEARVLSAQAAHAEAAKLALDRAKLLAEAGRVGDATDLLRATALENAMPAATRLAAAGRLGEFESLSAAEELARAAAYEAGGKPGLAARSLRAAVQRGVLDDAGLRLKLARLLYDERDYGPARGAFQRAAEVLTDRELKADAELHAARSLFRSGGQRDKARAVAEFKELAEKYEGTAAAGTALFRLGDESSTTQAALGYYRRAAAVKHSPDAREALFRVGDRSLKLKDPAGALRAWEEYVQRYPKGDQTTRVAYEAGKLHEAAGRESEARAMYTAATLASPLDYYALRAGNRLGIDPLERALAEPRPWIGLAADAGEAASVLSRLDLLDEMGLATEWEEEYEAAERAFAERPVALLTLAEGVRDRGHALRAIRLGNRLIEKRGGELDARVLRLVFPFPFRELLEREAERYDVDPMLLAGLVRQESTFRPAVKSWVGATGLGQIMPATGRWLAPSVGVRNYEERLLTVPEVNLRMAASYLSDLVDRYDGTRDLALAAYNAGPGRADRWRRELRRGRDTDEFRDAIPFDETRHYVKVVLRNAAVYERLYGNPPGAGLATANDR